PHRAHVAGPVPGARRDDAPRRHADTHLATGAFAHRRLLARNGGPRAEAARDRRRDRCFGEDDRRQGNKVALHAGQCHSTRVTLRPSALSTRLQSLGVALTSTTSAASASIGRSWLESL